MRTLLLFLSLWPAIAQPFGGPDRAQRLAAPDRAPEFSADRPGLAVSPAVLPPGVMQFEGGAAVSVEAGSRTVVLGAPLARYGVGSGVELRFGGDGLRLAQPPDGRLSAGRSDAVAGAKIALAAPGRFRPAISLVPSLSLPAGSRTFTSSAYDPALAIAWQKPLPGGLSAGGAFDCGAASIAGARRRRQSAALYAGFPVASGWSGYGEVYRARLEGDPAQWTADAGVSRLLGPAAQIDLTVGRSVGANPSGWFVAGGFAFRRLPH